MIDVYSLPSLNRSDVSMNKQKAENVIQLRYINIHKWNTSGQKKKYLCFLLHVK